MVATTLLVTAPFTLTVLIMAVGVCSALSRTDDEAQGLLPVLRPLGAPRLEKVSAATVAINPRLLRRFRAIAGATSAVSLANPQAVVLGRMLWYEPRLSRGGQLSCNSCHDLATYGVDHRATSLGYNGQRGKRNAPSVYNAAGHFVQFWDGRAADLETQAPLPILNPVEMAATRESAESALRAIPEYQRRFRGAFPGQVEPLTLENVGKALAAFERGLTTPSRWDGYLAGKRDALTRDEIEGLRVFLNLGCMNCHTGPQVGASMFQVAGFVEAWPDQRDQGRFDLTGRPDDRMVFKVPTMKNVALTGPYFHDGSSADLSDAVRLMGRHQLGVELDDKEIGSIVTFLGALTGKLPRAYIARPTLPPGPTPTNRTEGTR
jgi:cytochrome c peroxidase